MAIVCFESYISVFTHKIAIIAPEKAFFQQQLYIFNYLVWPDKMGKMVSFED